MAIRCILFDLDETLAESRVAIVNWWRGYFEHLGRPFLLPEQQHLLYSLPQEHIVRTLGLGDEGETAYRSYLTLVGVGRTIADVQLKPGARAALEYCRKYIVGLATSRSSALRQLLGHLEIEEYFQVIVSGETAPHFKPHPWGIHHVLERFQLDRHELVYVGDSPSDVEFAENGGVRMVAVGNEWRRGTRQPTWHLSEVGELPALLERLGECGWTES